MANTVRNSALLVVALILAGCGTSRPAQRGSTTPALERGQASWYGENFHGRKTASGERFDMHALTAAHKTLPLGSRVRVTNRRNGRSVDVRINDRGPYGRGRVIDLSRAAARAIGMIDAGVVPVTVEILSVPERRRR